MYDLVIRGGTIFDGTGRAAFVGDIAIADDRIAAIGAVPERGEEEIDASGKIVTPGWVDIHTHYDGQITWASRMDPSSTLGATTVVVGNCGVGFAPVRSQDHDTLIRLMEGVEDIPGAALHEGLSWAWESFADYMDAVDRLPHDIDVAVQVPHGALRVYVMGERGANRDPATSQENEEMRALTAEAIRAGALGFSTTRTMVHRTADGDLTPTVGAARAEMEAIAHGLADAGSGVIQWVSDFAEMEEEFGLIRDLTQIAGQPLSFSMVQADVIPDQWRELTRRLDQAVADGLPIKAQVAGRPVGLMLGLQGSVHPFVSRPSYQAIADLPLADKVAAMGDPAFRARLIAEAPLPDHPFVNSLAGAHHKMFPVGDRVEYEPDPTTSVAAEAARQGINPDELVYDALLADNGHAFLFFPMHNYVEGSLDNVRTMITNPNTLAGLSDGGAHVGAICDVSLPTFMLTHWCRDRTRGPKLDLAETIRQQTKDTAEAVGLRDRGVLAVGYLADINIIDFDALELGKPYMAYDLPTGARRLMQDATGYVATIKSGKVIYAGGEPTEALPGKLIRGRQPAPTQHDSRSRPEAMQPLIIEAALNGATPKSRNPHVPIAPEEITAQALAAFDAGAAIVHTHIESIDLHGEEAAARYMEGYAPILAARPNAILGGTIVIGADFEERFGHYRELAAAGVRMGAFDPGPVNLGTHGADGLPGQSFVYATSYHDIAQLVQLHDDARLAPAIAIYEPGWLRTTLAYERAGRLPRGAFVKLYFGGRYNFLDGQRSAVTFGLPPTEKALDAYLELLEGSALPWAVAAIGDCVIDTGLARLAIARGGHVRVGLEDFGGERQPDNIELIEEVVAIAREAGRPIATPAQAAQILDLPR